MAEKRSVTIHVPATTANLGPGFDCLGLALDLWNEVTVSLEGQELDIQIQGEGEKDLPLDKTNLIFQALSLAAEKYHVDLPSGISIKCINCIPISSGLGSSSSAIIAGLLAARELLNLEIQDLCLLEIGLGLEGHADNIAACLLGGLVVVIQDGSSLITNKLEIEPLKGTIVLPRVQLSTQQARKVLPDVYNQKDVVFNIGRTAAVIASLISGDLSSLTAAMQDRIHQPYRLALIPGAEAALNAAVEAGALGAVMSGSGPSLIAFYKGENTEIADAMKQAYENENTPVRIFNVITTSSGAFIETVRG